MLTPSASQPGAMPRASNSEQLARERVSSSPTKAKNFDAQLTEWASQGAAGEKRTVAANRMRACRNRANATLNLSNLKLKNLPECIGNLTALTRLDLSCNELTALPDNIARLTALTELTLTYNHLTTLPKSVTNLTALTKLDLAFNDLTKLPRRIANLTALTELDLSFNHLKALSRGVGDLTSLAKLDLSFNQLSALPESVANLPALQNLDLAENPLTTTSPSPGTKYLLRQAAKIPSLRQRSAAQPNRRVTFAPLPPRHNADITAAAPRPQPQPQRQPHPDPNVSTASVSLHGSRPIERKSAPATPLQPDDKNFRALCQRLAETTKKIPSQTTVQQIRPNDSGIACNAFNNVNVTVGRRDQQQRVPIHANEVKVTLFKKGRRVPANWVYLAGQSPFPPPTLPATHSSTRLVSDPQTEKFDACEKFIVQGIQSGQGVYQFVSRAAHHSPYRSDVSTREQPMIAQLEAYLRQPDRHFGGRYTNLTTRLNQHPRDNHDALRKEFQERLRPYLAVDAHGLPHPALLGGRYLIDKFERVPAHNKVIDERGDDHRHYLLTVIDCSTTPPSARTVPLTQAGLKFTNKVLAQKEIERAEEILGQHIGLWSGHDPSTLPKDWVKGVPPSHQQAPMIVSYAGIGRNATLIVYHEIMCKIKRGEVRTEKELDREMLEQISQGRKARGPRFIHSDDQLLALRQSLQSKLQRETKDGPHYESRQVQEWTGSPHNHPRTGHLQHKT